MTSTMTPIKERFGTTISIDDDSDASDFDGWFCVATDEWACPNPHCDFVAHHLTVMHLIVVWEEKDHPALLKHAQRAKEVGRNPHVVEYESSMGPAIDYHVWERMGQPVHGMRDE